MPPEVVESFLAVAVDGLQAGQPVPIQVGSLQALNQFCYNLRTSAPHLIAPFANHIYAGALPMLSFVSVVMQKGEAD